MKDGKEIIKILNKNAGEPIASIGDASETVDIIPTGITPLDFSLRIGGFPRGRIIDIYGMPSVGKSTICYTLIANAQKMGITCAIIDAENSFTKEYAHDFGINTSNLIVIAPNTLEQGAESIETLSKEGVGLIIIDSISTLIPRNIAEAEHGKPTMGSQARGISAMLLKLVKILKDNNTCLVCINQMRVNMMATGYTDRYTVTGGNALKFYSTIRIEMKRRSSIEVKGEQIGYTILFKITKNKLARPNIECEIPYLYDKGFDKSGDLVQMSIDKGIFTQSGAWVFYGEQKWQGKEKANETINSDPSFREKLISMLFQNPQ